MPLEEYGAEPRLHAPALKAKKKIKKKIKKKKKKKKKEKKKERLLPCSRVQQYYVLYRFISDRHPGLCAAAAPGQSRGRRPPFLRDRQNTPAPRWGTLLSNQRLLTSTSGYQ